METDITNPPMEVVIQEHKQRRDPNHNDAMHSRIRQLADYCGYTHEQLSNALKRELGFYTVVEVLGEKQVAYQSTKDFTNAQCQSVMERLDQLAGEFSFRWEVES